MNRNLLPLGVFLLLLGLLGYGLRLDPKLVPSPLIDKAAPAFSLAVLDAPDRQLATTDMLGQVWVLNVWASWCVVCRQEHAVITELAEQELVAVIGLNYKDRPMAASQWLRRYGNPYVSSVSDQNGRVGIDWGVYGVPETFVIDAGGKIRYKHVGPVTREVLNNRILPIIKELLT